MTDEELNEVRRLMLDAPNVAGLEAYARLTPEQAERMNLLAHAEGAEGVRRVIAEAEADGTMDRIRELYAQDQAKKE